MRKNGPHSGPYILAMAPIASLMVLAIGPFGCADRCDGRVATHHLERDENYPGHWWYPIPEEEAAWWEILPQEAGPGEVIVSKRNELGLLSNFAHTPFEFRGKRYQSLEGFWQMMKYPENSEDEREKYPGISWPHTREEVAQMIGHQAKSAGTTASENMKKMGINWVTFEGKRMEYRTPEKGIHYNLIVEATRAKVNQNQEVGEVLKSTGDLILRPDHKQAEDTPPAWGYCDIMMKIRGLLVI